MKLTASCMKPIQSSRRKPSGGAKEDPNSAAAEARRLGIKYSTWKARLKKVERGDMTMEEARTMPVATHSEVGRKYGKPNFKEKMQADIDHAKAKPSVWTRRAGN